MTDISVLQNKKKAYVDEKAQGYAKQMIEKGWLNLKVSTCDYSNWDRELHFAMPEIATELNKIGFSVSSTVNYGVTDWIITVK